MADITPTKTGYIRMLYCVIESSNSKEDVEWCKIELKRMILNKNERKTDALLSDLHVLEEE